MTMNTNFLSLKVFETDKDVEYWATRPFAQGALADEVRRADILVLPWEDFREGEPLLFPNGTADIRRALLEAHSGGIALLATPDSYSEIALHANVTRWPMLFVKQAVLPVVLSVLASELDTAAFHHEQNVELRIVIASQGRQCVQIDYKGPANDAVRTLEENAAKYCPQPIQTPAHGHAAPHAHRQPRG